MDETLDPTPANPSRADGPGPRVALPRSSGPGSGTGGERFAPGVVLVGRYRLVSRLGVGGMGEVYRADDLTLGTSVALKFLPMSATGDVLRRQKLLDEVRVAREVTHPNVCRVFDIGDYEGQLFLSMEYVDGEDLASLLRRIGRFPEDRAVEIARQICFGLAAAHEKGILHRDLKPANIMLDGRGKIRITDFGLAAVAEIVRGDEARAGTPAYMSPEQRRGEEVTARSDLYALGLVLHEAFTGKPALTGDTSTQLARSSASATTSRLSTSYKGIDPAIERIIERCLEPDPRDRPASAIAVVTALPGGDALAAAVAAGELPSPRLVAESGGRGRLSKRVGIALLAFFLLGLACRIWAYETTGTHRRITLDKSPEVLASRARDLAHKYAPDAAATDWTTSLTWRNGLIGHVYLSEGTSASLKRLSAELPASMLLFYRQAPTPLIPVPMTDTVDADSPAPATGDVQIELTMGGHLHAFRSMPQAEFLTSTTRPTTRLADTRPTPLDLPALFDDAGLQLAGFAVARPAALMPGAPADERLAWTGKYPDPEPFPVRVEVGLRQGSLAYFVVEEPWDLPRGLRTEIGYTRPPSIPQGPLDRFLSNLVAAGREGGFLLMVALYSISFAMAFNNLGRGTGDLRGGLRLSFFVFVCLVGGWALRAHHPLTSAFFDHFMAGLGRPLVEGLYIFAAYVALEPYIRARWPERLVSWSRLMDGRWRDPMVGRDVLVGLAGGAGLYFSVQVCLSFAPLAGYRISSASIGIADQLTSLPRALGYTVAVLSSTLLFAMLSAFLLVLLRRYLGRTWLAVAVFVPLWACTLMSQYGLTGPLLQIGSVLGYAGVMALLIVRFGLLANAVALAAMSLLLVFPSTATTESWWFSTFALLAATYAAVAILAFRRATA